MKQVRNTLQKEVTYDALRSIEGHPTAEDVYEKVHANYPSISKATVYRNLIALSNQGVVTRIPKIGDGSDRYDWNTRKHYHAKCMRCGRIFDVKLENQDDLMQKVKVLEDGFEIDTYNLVFEGLCRECRERSNNNGT